MSARVSEVGFTFGSVLGTLLVLRTFQTSHDLSLGSWLSSHSVLVWLEEFLAGGTPTHILVVRCRW